MKKLMTALAVCAVAGFAVAQTVTSANIVGYNTATIKPGFTMLSANFAAVTNVSASISLQNLFSPSGLIASNTVSQSDQIQIWNGSSFVGYFYQAYKATNPNKFAAGPAWVLTTVPGIATTATIPPGTGFWFSRPTGAGYTTTTVTVAGQVLQATTNTFALNAGFNMIGSAYPVDFKLNGGPFDWSTATASNTVSQSDQIQVWNGSSFVGYFYQAYKATNPNKFTAGPAWVLTTVPGVATTDSIPSGTGFWYARASGQSGTSINQATPIAQ